MFIGFFKWDVFFIKLIELSNLRSVKEYLIVEFFGFRESYTLKMKVFTIQLLQLQSCSSCIVKTLPYRWIHWSRHDWDGTSFVAWQIFGGNPLFRSYIGHTCSARCTVLLDDILAYYSHYNKIGRVWISSILCKKYSTFLCLRLRERPIHPYQYSLELLAYLNN